MQTTVLTADAARARGIHRSDMVACKLAFIDCKLPGPDRKENYSLIGSGGHPAARRTGRVFDAGHRRRRAVLSEPGVANLPLVLLPGTLCDHRVWDAMLGHWESGALPSVLTPSLRGARSAAAMAAGLLAQLPPRFAVMGFSLGGIVALELVAQAPERVAAIALVATSARADPPENAPMRRAAVVKARTGGLAAHVRADLWPRYVAPSRLRDYAILDLVVQMAEAVGLDAYDEQAGIASVRAASLPRLARITVPALVVGGDRDVLSPPDRQAEMADRLPSARWLQLEEVGHFVPLEAPAGLAGAAAAWLGSL